jgi:hypothetical protein
VELIVSSPPVVRASALMFVATLTIANELVRVTVAIGN